MKILNLFKDILSPKKCHSCNSEGHFLCRKCFNKLEQYSSFCYICKNKSKKFEVHQECKTGIFYDNLIVLTHYKNTIIRNLILSFKFYNKKDIGEDFGKYLAEKLIKTNLKILNNKDVIIVSTPMSFFRKLKRGYNHSELIALEISKILGIKYQKDIIKKIKNTRQQSILSRYNRINNLKNAFNIRKKYIDKVDKKIVILVDDVVSTGTTINEISKILKQNGAQKIIGLVIASD